MVPENTFSSRENFKYRLMLMANKKINKTLGIDTKHLKHLGDELLSWIITSDLIMNNYWKEWKEQGKNE